KTSTRSAKLLTVIVVAASKNAAASQVDPWSLSGLGRASEHWRTRRKSEAALEIVKRHREKRRNFYNLSLEHWSQSRRWGGDVKLGNIDAILGEIKGTIARRA
ncbi:hypothetical protein RUND412_004989, partial [Rhizina undulata]